MKDSIAYNFPDETARIRHTAAYINDQIESGHSAQLVAESEMRHSEQLSRIAQDICLHQEVCVVLMAGPSSSGKTSTSYRLCQILNEYGIQPLRLSLDNWFLEPGKLAVDQDGIQDYESIYALDLKQLRSDLKALIAGKAIALPLFNFLTSKREYTGELMQLQTNNLLLIEGIHALNPILTQGIAAASKYKIYVAPMSPVSPEGDQWISPSVNRLLRRIGRDARTRGRSPMETISLWPAVIAGEKKWIDPFREEADVQLDTSLAYELPALKTDLENALHTIPSSAAEYETAIELLDLLRSFQPLDTSLVPDTSILREFIGGSAFNVG